MNVNRIPNTTPVCKFRFDVRAGYSHCECRAFGVLFCQSKDQAKSLWLERHMGQEAEVNT